MNKKEQKLLSKLAVEHIECVDTRKKLVKELRVEKKKHPSARIKEETMSDMFNTMRTAQRKADITATKIMRILEA